MASEKRDAFICYSNKDQEIVERIVRYLERTYSITTWYAPADTYGDEFIPQIEKGLKASCSGVVFLSPSSVKSYWVTSEWQVMETLRAQKWGEGDDYKIIVVLLGTIEEEEIPAWLKRYDRVDFRGVENPLILAEKTTALARKIKPESISKYEKAAMSIPFVVLAMTRSQLEDIMRKDSECLQRLGYQCHWQDLQSLYGATPEEWRPSNRSKTIKEIIEEVLHAVSTEAPEIGVTPLFISSFFVAEDSKVDTWRNLDRRGGILIIDAVSLCHPELRECFEKSELSSKDNIAIIVIYPPDPKDTSSDCPADDFLQRSFPRAFDRFAHDWDEICELGIRREIELRRRLFAVSRKVAQLLSEAQPNPIKQKRARGRAVGYGDLVFKGGER